MNRGVGGFSLIELMIVLGIIGILAAVAMAQYPPYTIRSANNACLGEARAYMGGAVANLANGQAAPAYNPNACSAISAVPVLADYAAGNVIVFTVSASGDTNTTCNAASGSCSLP